MSAKKQNDFSDLSEVDAVRLVANTAIVAKESGHNVVVKVATIGGEVGVLVWMPGYTFQAGEIVANLPLGASEE